MHRFTFLAALAALLVAGALATGVRVGAGEEIDLDPRFAGYPEITIRIDEDQITAPVQVNAGRTLIIQENATEEEAHFFIQRIPDDITDEQVEADFASEETPDWFFRSTFIGNPDRAAPGGGRVIGLVDFTPGRYMVVDPLAPREPGRFEVIQGPAAGTATPASDDPEADVVATMYEMSFDLPATMSAGQQIWQVTNTGAAIHELAIMPVPAGTTSEQVVTAIGALFENQPVPAELGPAWAEWEFSLINGVGLTSPGGMVWTQFDLQPGIYAAVCFFPGSNGVPHLMDGMVKFITVTADGITTPTT